MNYYNDISKGYEELHREEQIAKLRLIKENIKLKTGAKILDLGCGPCWSDEFFDNVVGIEPSIEFVKTKDHIIKGRAEELPFENNSFDCILSITAIHHFDLDKAIFEMKRVAKPLTQICITVLKKSPKCQQIIEKLKSSFHLEKEIEENKDFILFMRNK